MYAEQSIEEPPTQLHTINSLLASTLLALSIITLSLSVPVAAAARETTRIRVSSWNVTHYISTPGISIYPSRAQARLPVDLALLRKYFGIIDGDLVSLQEIESSESAQGLAGTGYLVLFEPREFDRTRRTEPYDIFTSIAVRTSSKFSAGPPIELPELTLEVKNEDGSTSFTRAGVSSAIQISKSRFIFVSIHLKANCPITKVFLRPDCAVLLTQTERLASWLAEKIASGEQNFVIAGDWNRNFVKLGESDTVLQAVLAPTKGLNMPTKLIHSEPDSCTVRSNIYDYFLLIGEPALYVDLSSLTTVSPTSREISMGSEVGDHCAVAVDLVWPK